MFVLYLFLPYALKSLLPVCIASKKVDEYSYFDDEYQGDLSQTNQSRYTKDIVMRRPYANDDDIIENITENSKKNHTKFGSYMTLLTNASITALQNIKKNLKNNYYLDKNRVALVDELFRDIGDHEYVVRSNLKKIIEKDQFNQSKEFMLSFMDMSNFLMAKLLSFNMDRLRHVVTAKWYNEYINKIQRHELKAAFNYVEVRVCTLGVCKEKVLYSDYLRHWLRCILYMEPSGLQKFYSLAPESLFRYRDILQTSVRFKANLFTIQNSDVVVQKDSFDFIDEVLSMFHKNNNSTLNKVPKELLNKAVPLLKELFQIIDTNYDINKFNKYDLEDITASFNKLLNENYEYIYETLADIMENMKKNLKIWPINIQSRLFVLWSEIINVRY